MHQGKLVFTQFMLYLPLSRLVSFSSSNRLGEMRTHRLGMLARPKYAFLRLMRQHQPLPLYAGEKIALVLITAGHHDGYIWIFFKWSQLR